MRGKITAMKPRRRHLLAIALVSAPLVLAGALAWLAGSESALRWSARQVESLSNGVLAIGDVHGSLYGPLHIGTVSFTTEHRRIEASDVSVNWTPRALLRRHLQIDAISAQALTVSELQPDPEPLRLPESLRMPVTVAAPDIRVGQVEIERGGERVVLTGIDLGAHRHADGYRLELRALASAWGRLRADLDLGDTQPFDVRGNAELQRTAEGGNASYQAEAKAGGNLTQIAIEATARALGAQARITASVAPFETIPLVSAHVTAENVDPAQLHSGVPPADLAAEIAIARREAGGFDGRFTLKNARPGGWDRARLPLRELAGGFSGTLETLDLAELVIDLGAAGRFGGEGRFSERRLQLALSTARFDPHGLHGKIRPMQLAGDIRVQALADSLQLTAGLRDRRFRFLVDARQQGDDVELRNVSVLGGSGRLDAKGALTLAEPGRFRFDGTLKAFDPAEFGAYPAARINASFASHGRFADEPQAAVRFSIGDSRFRNQPLAGEGTLSLSARRVWDVKTSVQLGGSRLVASGALGNPADRLDFQIDSDNLAALAPEIGGVGHASGFVEGRFAAPTGNVRVQASNLSWRRQYRLASLQASILMGKGIDGPLHVESSLRGLVAPQLRVDRASLNADGTRDNHTLQLLAKNASFDLQGRFAGGWRENAGWRGEALELVNRGDYAFTLLSPARLEVGPRRLNLNEARVDLAGGALRVHELAYEAGRISSRGEFRGLPLAYLKRFVQGNEDFETNLTLGGTWQLAVADRVDGRVALWREGGDIAYLSNVEYLQEPKLAFGLDRFTLDMEAVNNRLQVRAEANGAQLGSVKAEARSELSRRDGAWGIAGDAPVRGRADLAVKTLSWLQPILESAVSFDGALDAQLRFDGRMAQPAVAGSLSGTRFSLALLDQGVKFTDGRFKAEFRDRLLQLNELTLRGGKGTLDGTGRLALENGAPSLRLDLRAKELEVLASPDRQLTLSGTSELSVAGQAVRVAARLKADRGLIELPKAETPTLSRDVVVLGRETPPAIKKPPYQIAYDLDLDLGERFVVKGKGLDAQLGGALKLTGTQEALPSSRGSIRVVKGTYEAYGQQLEIERGFLNFQGPLDNPGLNIVAMRKNQLVEAGVSVAGTARAPLVTLVSNPTVPDGQKLSWLVLGHGTEDSSPQEFNALQIAARALFSAGGSASLQQRVADATGLDKIGLKGAGGLESTVLTVGKRISSRAYLTYEQGLASTSTLLKINYLLTQALSLRVQAGQSPAVDLFYTFSFD